MAIIAYKGEVIGTIAADRERRIGNTLLLEREVNPGEWKIVMNIDNGKLWVVNFNV